MLAHSTSDGDDESPKKPTRVKIEIDDDTSSELEAPIKRKTSFRDAISGANAVAASSSAQQQQRGNASTGSSPATSPTTTTAAAATSSPLTSRSEQFHFTCIAGTPAHQRQFPMCGGDRELTQRMAKWGLGESMQCVQYSYDMIVDGHTYATSKSATVPGQVHAGMMQEFALALFNSEAFLTTFRCGDGRGAGRVPLSALPGPITSVTLAPLRVNATTLDMFDRLTDRDELEARGVDVQICRADGRSCNMLDVFLPCGITVSDQLRGVFMLSEDESETYRAYSDAERSEFLFHVMWRVVAGGAVNQYEDELVPYKEAARDIYKSLISVGRARGGDASELVVQSLVCAVQDICVSGGGGKAWSMMRSTFFPKDDRTGNHNFMYLVVDPIRRTVCVWYNAFFSPF